MKAYKFTYLLLLFTFLASSAIAQSGRVFGIISDGGNAEPLIGATVMIVETSGGTVTEIDGSYELKLDPGNYTLEVSFTGYQPQKVTELAINGGENLKMDFVMSAEVENLVEVVVKAEAKRNSYANLMLLQQRSISIATGISSEQIKLSPDRNTSDVLKRVSGASVQDNKYVIIRGLADRYNTALMNGLSLPSTEPDKRAFSFNIFPSNLLDNLIIYKSATPDLPGEFAGGVIQLNTKETPQEPFATISISTGFNSQSTFKPYQTYQGGKTDWLGQDDGTRELPSELKNIVRDTFNSSKANQQKYSQLFANDWGIIDESSLRPSVGLQVSAGRSFNKLGVVGALTYNNSPRIEEGERGDFTNDGRAFQYFDTNLKTNVGLGGLLNLAYKLSPTSRIQLNNALTISTDDLTSVRNGQDFEQGRFARAYSYWYTSTKLQSHQLLGDHVFGERQVKLNWGLGYNKITRDVPSYRRLWYFLNTDAPEGAPYQASIQPGNPSPNFAGNFYSNQNENFYVGKFDLTIPYLLGSRKGSVKFGALYEDKSREFDARVYGFVSSFQTDPTLYELGPDQLFDSKNIGEQGFLVKDGTDRSDSYDGGTSLTAGYAMMEQLLTQKLRAIAGVRVEKYAQNMNSYLVRTTTPVEVDTAFTDVLPSVHLIYSLTEKSNLRATVSKTVSRPNLREIAPFSFYDFFIERGLVGNPDLVRTNILNADLRFETYPGQARYFAASVFYKKFENPIEQVQMVGTNILTWENVPSAVDYGVELEGRWNLGSASPFLSDFTVFGNLSYIYSDVDISELGEGQLERPLYGQSPYLVNLGLNYHNKDHGISSTLLFNRIGRRIWLVGIDQDPHVWEAPRSVLDFQISKNIGRYGELKLTVGDLLNQKLNFYQDMDDNGKYSPEKDQLIISNRFGTNITVGFNYTLSRG